MDGRARGRSQHNLWNNTNSVYFSSLIGMVSGTVSITFTALSLNHCRQDFLVTSLISGTLTLVLTLVTLILNQMTQEDMARSYMRIVREDDSSGRDGSRRVPPEEWDSSRRAGHSLSIPGGTRNGIAREGMV